MHTQKSYYFILNKFLMMMKNYNQSVKINYDLNWPVFLTVLIEF